MSRNYNRPPLIEALCEFQFNSEIPHPVEDIEKDIVVFFPPKSQRIVKAHIRKFVRPAILITEDDIR